MGELLPSDPTIAQPIEAWIDEAGQLRVRCCAFAGYLKNDAATAELGTPEEGYRTGDAVRLDERNQLVFLDRLKDMRRLRTGQPYPPQFIENSLRASPFIKDAMVLGDESSDFVAALINVNPDICGRFAERHGLAYGTFGELSQLPEIRAEIAGAIREVNRRLEAGARVRFVRDPAQGARRRRGRADPLAQAAPRADRGALQGHHRRHLRRRRERQRTHRGAVPGRAQGADDSPRRHQPRCRSQVMKARP